MITKTWPPELEQRLANPKTVALTLPQTPLGCPNCGGSGTMAVYSWQAGPLRSPNGGKVKWLDLGNGRDGWYTGEYHYANCPVCRADGMADYLRRNSGLAGEDLDVSLEGFKVNGAYAGKGRAREQAAHLLGPGRATGGIYTFWGGYGCGKSHLLKALVNGFRRAGALAQYQVMAEMLASIRERFGNERGEVQPEEVIDNLQRIRVLCLDEIDRANLTGWAKETIFRVIDARYARPDLVTVLATNTNPDDLAGEYGFGYIVSRLRSGIIVEVPGPDVREALGARARKERGM